MTRRPLRAMTIAAAIVVLTAPAGAEFGPARITITPLCDAAGAPPATYSIFVSGENFLASADARITFDPDGTPEWFSVISNANGELSATITPYRRPPGSYIIRVEDLRRHTAEAIFTVPCRVVQADLNVVKADFPDPVKSGDEVTYTVTVRNDGPDPAVSVSLIDTPSANAPIRRIVAGLGATCFPPLGQQFSCSSPLLPPTAGFIVTVTVAANAPPGTSIENTATVNSSTVDPDSVDNRAVERTLVQEFAPRLRMDPPFGRGGRVVSAVGEGFPPDTDVALDWDKGPEVTVTVRSDADGAFRRPVFLFNRDSFYGPRLMVATGPGFVQVQAPFFLHLSTLIRARLAPDTVFIDRN